MNGYIMYGRPLDVRLIDQKEKNKFQLIRANKKFKYVPWKIIHKKQFNNEDKTDDQIKKSLVNLIKSDAEKEERLKELGITFDFPKYKNL